MTIHPVSPRYAQRSIFVQAHEWFDKTGGVTYFDATVWVDGKPICTLPMTNGYGDQFEYDAAKALVQRGYLPQEMLNRNIRWAQQLGLDVYTTRRDARKRELVKTLEEHR